LRSFPAARRTIDCRVLGARARRALRKAIATCSYTYNDPADAEEFASAKRVLDEILTEYSGR
jgi:hypothetical protein